MPTNTHHESAVIYNFAEFAAKLRPISEHSAASHQDSALGAARLAPATFGNAWYHEEAIQDSTGPRAH